MPPLIVYVHGLQSTSKSFNYLRGKFPCHDWLNVSYDASESLLALVDNLVETINGLNRDVMVVAHSLGGVISAVAAARTPRIVKLVTLSSPFGGSEAASLLRWVCHSPSINNIHPGAPLMTAARSIRITQPALAIVTTAGASPFIAGANDGVVTVNSQQAINGPTFVSMNVNHFEVLLCEQVAQTLKAFLFDGE